MHCARFRVIDSRKVWLVNCSIEMVSVILSIQYRRIKIKVYKSLLSIYPTLEA